MLCPRLNDAVKDFVVQKLDVIDHLGGGHFVCVSRCYLVRQGHAGHSLLKITEPLLAIFFSLRGQKI